MDGILTALESSFTTITTDAMSVIATAIPSALVVVGAVMVVVIGIKVFKKVTDKA